MRDANRQKMTKTREEKKKCCSTYGINFEARNVDSQDESAVACDSLVESDFDVAGKALDGFNLDVAPRP